MGGIEGQGRCSERIEFNCETTGFRHVSILPKVSAKIKSTFAGLASETLWELRSIGASRLALTSKSIELNLQSLPKKHFLAGILDFADAPAYLYISDTVCGLTLCYS